MNLSVIIMVIIIIIIMVIIMVIIITLWSLLYYIELSLLYLVSFFHSFCFP